MKNGLFVIGEIRGVRVNIFSWVDKKTGERKQGERHLLKVETSSGDFEFTLGSDSRSLVAELDSLRGTVALIPVSIWKDKRGYFQSFYRGSDLPKKAPDLSPKLPASPAAAAASARGA